MSKNGRDLLLKALFLLLVSGNLLVLSVVLDWAAAAR